MLEYGSKDRHQKAMCLKEIGLRAQNMLTILNNHHDRGDVYDHFHRRENLHFHNEEDSHMSSQHYQANGSGHDMDLLIILH